MMRHIVEWAPGISILLIVGILILTFLWGYVRDKQISHQRYQHVEKLRMALGKDPIPWRGSMARYLEDVKMAEAQR